MAFNRNPRTFWAIRNHILADIPYAPNIASDPSYDGFRATTLVSRENILAINLSQAARDWELYHRPYGAGPSAPGFLHPFGASHREPSNALATVSGGHRAPPAATA